MGGFDGVQVLALDVLDQRQLQHLRIGDFLNHHRNFGQSSQLGRSPAALAGDNLVMHRRAAARSAAE